MIAQREGVHGRILVLDSDHRIGPGAGGARESIELGDAGAQCLETRIGRQRFLCQRSGVIDCQGGGRQ